MERPLLRGAPDPGGSGRLIRTVDARETPRAEGPPQKLKKKQEENAGKPAPAADPARAFCGFAGSLPVYGLVLPEIIRALMLSLSVFL